MMWRPARFAGSPLTADRGAFYFVPALAFFFGSALVALPVPTP
jgi:hypothetical protein